MDTPHLRKRKTSTVSPAKPGDYSLDLNMKNRQKPIQQDQKEYPMDIKVYDGNAQVFYNARFVEVMTVDGADYLVFDYLGDAKRVPTFGGSARAAKDSNEEQKWFEPGLFGVVMNTDTTGDAPMFRWTAYLDQTLRRAFELDTFEGPDPDDETLRRNLARIGWRNQLTPGGFLAPTGIIPGKNGDFIDDETGVIMVDVPPEFHALCWEFKRTAEEILRGFMADAAGLMNYVSEPRADRLSSNGSDERGLAYGYLDRAYGMFRNDD